MPKYTKLLTFLIVPALLLFAEQPSEAQNRGVRGGSQSVRGSAPRASAPRASAPRSAPRASAPRSAPRASAPRSTPRAVPRSAPSRSSAPRANNSYRAPQTRQTVAAPNRASNSSYRAVTRPSVSQPSSSASSVRVTGAAPRASYPGRINTNTSARTYTPQANPGRAGSVTNGQVRAYTGAPTSTVAVPGSTNRRGVGGTTSVTTSPNGGTATTAVPGRFQTAPGNQVRVAPTNPTLPSETRVTGYRPGGQRAVSTYQPVQPVVTGPVYNNTNNYYNNNRGHWGPRYRDDCYDPYLYSNYNYRRGFRYYQPCYTPFLSLGFFVARPYSYYDYARIDYAQPFVYGDDQDYRSAPVIDNQVASTQPVAPTTLEQDLLTELARYVEANSVDQRFRVADPAFGGQMWSLDLTQAPAVYSIDSNHYSVVSGFEGTLGENTIPSSVGLEFFVARENGRWSIKEAWIVSANGIPRAKKFQSPTYPQVQTWQPGETCPFSGQPMVPISQSGAQRG